MNIVLTQSDYSDSMWSLFYKLPTETHFLLRDEGVYLTQTATEKLAPLKSVSALNADIQQRGLSTIDQVTPISLSAWLEDVSTDTPWATF